LYAVAASHIPLFSFSALSYAAAFDEIFLSLADALDGALAGCASVALARLRLGGTAAADAVLLEALKGVASSCTSTCANSFSFDQTYAGSFISELCIRDHYK
jgi:hypothetical protein